jgi:hypothetical protein
VQRGLRDRLRREAVVGAGVVEELFGRDVHGWRRCRQVLDDETILGLNVAAQTRQIRWARS